MERKYHNKNNKNVPQSRLLITAEESEGAVTWPIILTRQSAWGDFLCPLSLKRRNLYL